MRVSAPGRSYDHHDSLVTELARYACKPGMLAIPNSFRSLDTWTWDPWMFKIHDCLRSMHARKTWGGADSRHAKGPCYATVKAIAGDSSFFNHTIRGAGSVHAGRSCRRGYDSGQLSLSTIPYSPQRGPAAKIKPAPRSQIRARILSTTHHNTAMINLEITRVRKHGLQ